MKGALPQNTPHLMVFKLVLAVSKTWERPQGQNQLPEVIQGVQFRGGIAVARKAKAVLDSCRSPKSAMARCRHAAPRSRDKKTVEHISNRDTSKDSLSFTWSVDSVTHAASSIRRFAAPGFLCLFFN
jgi:hypothetical protein